MTHTQQYKNQYKKTWHCLLIILASFAAIQTKAQQPRSLPAAYSNTIPISYVRTWDAVKPSTSTDDFTINTDVKTARIITQYVDGLGRPLQTVVKQGSMQTNSNATDFVSTSEYDAYGREVYKYLPSPANNTGGNTHINDGLFKLNPFQQQAAFYSNTDGAVNPIANQGETYYYSKTVFEASPLNRVDRVFQPGNNWMGKEFDDMSTCTSWPDPVNTNLMYNLCVPLDRSVKSRYYVNADLDEVKIWNVGTTSTGAFTNYTVSGNYPAGELYKTIVLDENNKGVIEFTDKEGKVILKKVQLTANSDFGQGSGHTGWLCTYYIYDDFNNLRAVIQPEGVKMLPATGWSLTSTLLAEQCFRYEYDDRNRMIMKKVPGAGEVYMVYDARDRLVMTQDANLRALTPTPKWMITKYDELNRPVETGLWNNDGTTFSNHLLNASVNTTGYPTTSSGYEELTKTFYDNYTWLGNYSNPLSNTYNTSYNTYFQPASNTAWPYAQANTQSALVKGMPTGSRIKVLGTASYVYTVSFYDDKGRVIQTQNTNMTGGTDIATTQYTWAGQPLVTVQQQQKLGANAQTTIVVSQVTYDDLGRVIKTEKKQSSTLAKVNGVLNAMSAYKVTAQNEYDALGQLKKKKLAPAYGSGGLETLTYDYNIRGWMLGMNRGYANDEADYSNRYFGFDLGYDKINNGLANNQAYVAAQYNGNIAGTVWKSKGDGEKRKYDFAYDAANRLLKADFTQYTNGVGFNQSAGVNYNIKMGDGTDVNTAYDYNGNIKQMQQWGLKGFTSVQLDNLAYTYEAGSNKLSKVTDAVTTDNKLGDFKDGANGSGTDYWYDLNGNLTLDNNKAISSITYNHLNLPWVITVTGKGTITYTYDAVGSKIKKITQENNATVAYNGTNYTTNITTNTLYLGGAVYESKAYSHASLSALNYTDKLQFIGMEEGRIRFKETDNSLQYDYMLTDHLGNIRMVLTEELKQDKYPAATLEGTYADANTAIGYEKLFYTINTANVVDATSIPAYQNNNGVDNPYPAGNSGNTNVGSNSSKVYKLQATASGGVNGLGMTLKVMSGDKIDILGKSYYAAANSGGVNYSVPVLDILSGLLGAPGSTAATKGFTATDLNGQSNITSPISSFLSDVNRGTGTVPKAYINWVLLDENFKYVSGSFSRVGTAGSVKSHYDDLSMQNIAVTKNGYLYVYASNESPVAVFFDNLQVIHTRGAILEESHYYPFGLTMNAIGSRALAFEGTENKEKFNGKEVNSDLSLDWYEYGFRNNYDPQIGRFHSVDPLADEYTYYTPYQFAGNEVPNAVDVDGLEPYRINIPEIQMIDFFNDGFSAIGQQLESVIVSGVKKNITQTLANVKSSGGFWSEFWNDISRAASETWRSVELGAKKVGSFAKDFYYEGVLPGLNWINHNVNPVYGVFNGVQAQFTNTDFLDQTPMTNGDGASDIVMSFMPGGPSL